MKTLVGVLLLAGAAWFGYRWFGDYRAYQAYEGFAEAWVHEDRVAAARYGDSASVQHAFEKRAIRGTRGGAAMEALRGDRYEVESRTRTSDDEQRLVVKQTVHFDPPGVTTGIGGAMYAHFRHTASVRKTADGWRVVSFDSEFLDMGEIRRRAS
jgi:hypothetical protein